MPEQLFLPGMPTLLKSNDEALDRLFLAVFPDTTSAAQIARLREPLCAKHGLSGSRIAPDRFHVTLHHLGDFRGVPEHVVEAASMAAAATAASKPPFEITFDHVESFSGRPGRRPFVLRANGSNADLMELHRRLVTALGKRGNVKFVPHITLLYDEQGVAKEPVDPVSWTINEIVLIRSLLGKTRHIPLGRWKLEG